MLAPSDGGTIPIPSLVSESSRGEADQDYYMSVYYTLHTCEEKTHMPVPSSHPSTCLDTHLLTYGYTLHSTASQPDGRGRCDVTDGFKPSIVGCQCKRSHNQRPALSQHMLTLACVSFGCPLATNRLVRLDLLSFVLSCILSHTYASQPARASSNVSSDVRTQQYLVYLLLLCPQKMPQPQHH